jgi:hypothetical protein
VVLPRGDGDTYNTRPVHYGLINFHPKELLVTLSTTESTTATFHVKQHNNTVDHFRALIGCALELGGKPKVSIDGEKGTIDFPATTLPLDTDVVCQITVTGKGGVTGTLPVYAVVGI